MWMVDRALMEIEWVGNSFLFRMEGTTGIPCEGSATSHVPFDTSFRNSWVRDSTDTSRTIRWADFCEVANTTRERRNYISASEVLLRDAHFPSKVQISTHHEGFIADGCLLRQWLKTSQGVFRTLSINRTLSIWSLPNEEASWRESRRKHEDE